MNRLYKKIFSKLLSFLITFLFHTKTTLSARTGIPHTYTASYSRTDMLTGPGLSTPIFNSDSKNYLFSLLGQDGVPDSGPDFDKVVNDTVLNAKSNWS